MNQNKSIIETLTRDEMIQILIEDRLTDWVYARNYDSLEYFLLNGWGTSKDGYESYSDNELKEELEDRFDEDQIKDYLKSSKQRIHESEERMEGGEENNDQWNL